MKLIFLFILLGVFSVNAQDKIDLYGHRNDFEKVRLSEVAQSVTYIPLETREECLLGDELQIFYGKEAIFVGDQKMGAYYRFDKKGKFLNQIGRKGNGPGEYASALYFYVDEPERRVCLISPQTKTVYAYGYEGNFLGKTVFEETPWMIQKVKEDYLFYNSRFNRIKSDQDVKELYLADKEGKIKASLPTTIEDQDMDMLLFEMPFFYIYQGNIFYKNPLLDMVYRIGTPLALEPCYEIQTGPMNRSKNDFKNMERLAEQVSIRTIIETDALLLIVYAYRDSFYNLYVDKAERLVRNVRNEFPGFVEDLKGGPDFLAYWQGSSSEKVLISLLTDQEIERQEDKFNQVASKEPGLAVLEYYSNPVLVVATLK